MRTMIWGSALLVAAVLSGCGGAEGFSQREDKVTISGTVARGRALEEASVTVLCTANGGRTETNSDGTYTITIVGATLPCILEATSVSRVDIYRSLLAGRGRNGSFVVNISPLTELVVALATGRNPGTYFSNFIGSPFPSDESIAQAIDKLRELFAGRLDLADLNPLTDELIAASTDVDGNDHDQQIEALMAILTTAKATLQLVTSAIVTSPGEFDPVRTILAPAAATCSGLRSGRYRLIRLYETDPLRQAAILEIDAVALAAVDTDGAPRTLTADAGQPCQFSLARPGETNTLIASQAGILVVYTQSTTSDARAVALGLPEQVLPVSELAGTWNSARWAPTASPAPGRVATAGVTVVDSSGAVTASSSCQGQADCIADAGPLPRFATNADGGFDISDGNTPLGRAFLFKTATGKAVFVSLADAGSLSVATRQESLGALPGLFSANSVSNFRAFDLNGSGTISNLTDDTVTVTAVDKPAKIVTRRRASDARIERLVYDAPRDGLRYRAANDCTIADVAADCPELVQLPLQDSGVTLSLSVGTDPASASFNIAVSKPTN